MAGGTRVRPTRPSLLVQCWVVLLLMVFKLRNCGERNTEATLGFSMV